MVARYRRRGPIADQRGVALVIVMMASVVLLAVAGSLVHLSTLESGIVGHQRRAVEGHYAAEAALAVAVATLNELPDWSVALSRGIPVGWIEPFASRDPPIDLRERTDALRRGGADGAGRALPWRLFAAGPLQELIPTPPGYGPWLVAVWVADDVGDGDVDTTADANGVVVLHAAAFGPRAAERAVQATVARGPMGSGPRPATVTGWRSVR